MRLRGSGTREKEGGAVDDSVDAVHGRFQRAVVEEIAPHDFCVVLAQLGRATWIAHKRADLITPEGESSGEAASDLSGRSSDEDSHGDTVERLALFHKRSQPSVIASLKDILLAQASSSSSTSIPAQSRPRTKSSSISPKPSGASPWA